MKTLSRVILDLTNDPNLIGEILRDKFFKQDKENGNLGCYSTFELREDVTELPGEINLDYKYVNGEGAIVTCAQLDDITMKYFWDRDGNLSFYFSNDRILNNSDTKKNYGWKWILPGKK